MDIDNNEFDIELGFEEIGADDANIITVSERANQIQVSRQREAKLKIEALKEQQWFKRRNWFDDEAFFDQIA